MNTALLSLRMLGRDWRSGELKLLLIALIVAVGSVTSVEFLNDRVYHLLKLQASQLLGGDLVIAADHPVPPSFRDAAQARGLSITESVSFPSMVFHGERNELASILAVGDPYPLRGTLRVAAAPGEPGSATARAPVPGTAWVEPRLLAVLGLVPGDRLMLGQTALRIEGVITQEPGQSGALFSIGPRLLVNVADLPATALVQPGSRISYRLLVAGEPARVDEYRRYVSTRLSPGERVEGVEDARPEVRSALTRGKRFLGLAALSGVMLAAVAIAIATRRFVQRHLDSCAMMRCLGASHSEIFALFALQLLVLGTLGSVAGCFVGYLGQGVLAKALGALVAVPLPFPSALPAASGLFTGLAITLGFAFPPLTRLRSIPALRVLRRDLGAPTVTGAMGYLIGGGVFVLLLIWQAGEWRLGLYVTAAVSAVVGLLGLLALCLVYMVNVLRRGAGRGLRLGLISLTRRSRESVLSVLAFGIGLMALLLVTTVRSGLLDTWHSTLPAGAPNRFLVNIQPDQVAELRAFMTRNGLEPQGVFPMVRGRLESINGAPVEAQSYESERARRLVRREFNLSWASNLQEDNTLVAGRWWQAEDYGRHVVSVEEGLASTLGIRLHDELVFSVAGNDVVVTVASLRGVEWDSFHPNFFVIAPPGVLNGFPSVYITSFYVDEASEGVLGRLVERFPNITIIDVSRIMAQVRGIMDNVATAVEYVFVFTLLAGLMILYAGILASMDERLLEGALLRVFGAEGREVLSVLVTEFAVLGVLAGAVAAAAASVAGRLLASRVFDLAYLPDPLVWVYGIVGGGVVVALAGTLGARAVLKQSPMRVLRDQ